MYGTKCYKLEARSEKEDRERERKKEKSLIVTLDRTNRQLFASIIITIIYFCVILWQKANKSVGQIDSARETTANARNILSKRSRDGGFSFCPWKLVFLVASIPLRASRPKLITKNRKHYYWVTVSSRAPKRTKKDGIRRFAYVFASISFIYFFFYIFSFYINWIDALLLPDRMHSNNPSMKYIPNGSLIFTFWYDFSCFFFSFCNSCFALLRLPICVLQIFTDCVCECASLRSILSAARCSRFFFCLLWLRIPF